MRNDIAPASVTLQSALHRALSCALLAALLAASAHADTRQVDSIAERVVPCASCHGAQGRATSEGWFPRIAGKPAGYLQNQLINFRDGRRNYPRMVYLIEHLSDDYLGEMARYYESLDLPYPPPEKVEATPQMLERGEQLARKGDPARKLPACASCHGANMLGAKPYVPGLLGLSRAYLGTQLESWKVGTRRAHAPDCMAGIATQLTREEVGALSAWLAAQPVPAGARPAEKLPATPPVACGSIPK